MASQRSVTGCVTAKENNTHTHYPSSLDLYNEFQVFYQKYTSPPCDSIQELQSLLKKALQSHPINNIVVQGLGRFNTESGYSVFRRFGQLSMILDLQKELSSINGKDVPVHLCDPDHNKDNVDNSFLSEYLHLTIVDYDSESEKADMRTGSGPGGWKTDVASIGQHITENTLFFGPFVPWEPALRVLVGKKPAFIIGHGMEFLKTSMKRWSPTNTKFSMFKAQLEANQNVVAMLEAEYISSGPFPQDEKDFHFKLGTFIVKTTEAS